MGEVEGRGFHRDYIYVQCVFVAINGTSSTHPNIGQCHRQEGERWRDGCTGFISPGREEVNLVDLSFF